MSKTKFSGTYDKAVWLDPADVETVTESVKRDGEVVLKLTMKDSGRLVWLDGTESNYVDLGLR